MSLIELAERCEAAWGSDRELDEAIAEILEPGMFCRDQHRRLRKNIHGTVLTPQWDLWSPPAYTASLDAAMTLVPEDCLSSVKQLWNGPERHAFSYVSTYCDAGDGCGGKHHTADYSGLAATPALALCAAALRARAAQ